MLLKNRLMARYIFGAITPYFFLALLLLTVALSAQQSTKFAEVFSTAGAPLSLAVEIFIYLLPNILVFTLPMSALAGVIIGMCRLGSDSELTAMRAAGFGTASILAPSLILGVLIGGLTFYIGFKMAPAAASDLRRVAINAAFRRLESPVEPRSFYTDLPGKVVFVRDGDLESGQWERVFIYWKEDDGQVRLVTARSGRIDTSGERAEIVLSDAVATTLPKENQRAGISEFKVMSERSDQLRMRDARLDEQRRTLLRRLRTRNAELDEMGFDELITRARSHEAAATRLEASLAFHKKFALCFSALTFSLLGAAMGLWARRGGRGLGMLLSLATMIAYYLILLWGEHLARTDRLPPAAGVWLANALAVAVGLFFLGDRGRARLLGGFKLRGEVKDATPTLMSRRYIIGGLMDRVLIRSVSKAFFGALVTLITVFIVFTLFELLRFLASNSPAAQLIPRYIFFLLPLIGVAMAPMSVLVAVLVAYALLARRSESVAWWASGQSTYRLAVPAILFSVLVCVGLWLVQERVMPSANRRQEALRARIRGGEPRAETLSGQQQWLASADTLQIYSYHLEDEGASLISPSVFEFDKDGVHLKRVILGEMGEWANGGALLIKEALMIGERGAAGWEVGRGQQRLEVSSPEVFMPTLKKPSEMSAAELSIYLKQARGQGGGLRAPLSVALERKRSDPLSPLVMALIGIPMAFAFGKRSSIAALCAAIVVGLIYWAAVGGFQQLGNMGMLPPALSAWAPAVICSLIGIYLLSRSRT